MTKLLFTGGHHNSAVALIDWLKEKDESISYVWVGKKKSPEYKEVRHRNIPFYNIYAGKLFRATSIRYLHKIIWNLLIIPVGFLTALRILSKEKPTLIISFGGFIALPIIFAGKILKIPSVTHEQTTTMGLANSLIAKYVDKIYVSWPVTFYPEKFKEKLVYTGLPLRKSLFNPRKDKKFVFKNKKPVLYVTGGKSGASVLNTYVLNNLTELLSSVNIIWQTGSNSEYNNTRKIKDDILSLNDWEQEGVFYQDYYDESDIGEIFNNVDLVVSRGGAHTVYELLALKIPAIIIPIPWSSNNEQYKNAQYFESSGLGVLFDQEEIDAEGFLKQVLSMITNLNKWKIKDSKFDVLLNGQECLGNEIFSQLKK